LVEAFSIGTEPGSVKRGRAYETAASGWAVLIIAVMPGLVPGIHVLL
jgi:hypothetical protein